MYTTCEREKLRIRLQLRLSKTVKMNYCLKAPSCKKAQLCCQERQDGPHGAQVQSKDRLIPDTSFIIGIHMSTKKCQQNLITVYSGRCWKVRSLCTQGGIRYIRCSSKYNFIHLF